MTDLNEVARWYIIHTHSGFEAKVISVLKEEIAKKNLGDFFIDFLVPTQKTLEIKKGKKVEGEKKFYPGYIMIKADLTGELPHVIKSVTNVIGFLGETKGGDPVPLRPAEVNRMLGKVDELSLSTEQINIPYVIGENIKVIDGPFNGFTGAIEKINEDKRKLEVMVKIFGRKTPLELSYMQVEKL